MARQIELLPKPPRRPRTWRMHVVDAGAEAVRFECRRCGYDSGWLRYDEGDSVSRLKRGLPCPRCNAGNDDAAREQQANPQESQANGLSLSMTTVAKGSKSH